MPVCRCGASRRVTAVPSRSIDHAKSNVGPGEFAATLFANAGPVFSREPLVKGPSGGPNVARGSTAATLC